MDFNNIDRRVIVAAILISVVTIAYIYQITLFSSQQTQVTRIVWERSGGFAGLDETLAMEADGSATLSSNLIGVVEFMLSQNEWETLLNIIEEPNFMRLDTSYGPRSGVADFFSYSVEVTTKTKTYFIEWVDDWASEKTLPDVLKMIEEYILLIIQGDGSGAIEGTIYDNQGESVSGLVVSIVNGSVGYPEIAVLTGDKGFYSLSSVPPGIFTLGVHDDLGNMIEHGYFHVLSGKTTVLNITVNIQVDNGGEEDPTSPEKPVEKGPEGVAVGSRALDFSVVGLEGDTFRLSEHRDEVVIVEFMTTWCGICKLQHVELEKLHEEMSNLTIVTVEIDITLTQDNFITWALEQEYTWLVGHSPEVGWSYRVSGFPTVILVDGEGIIRYRRNLTSFTVLVALVRQYQ